MKIDALVGADLAGWAATAARAEALGYDGLLSPEIAHDPFLPLALAAPATSKVDLITGIAVAFARNPMSVAVTASDLQRLSGGRLILGLGSQVKGHITRRYSMPWSKPVDRMREFILAVRAVWASWNESTPLTFEGEFYRHTLMTPMFDQGPSPVGDPKIFLAAVGPAMTAVAGEVADGVMLHGFTTASYVEQVSMPRLAEGLAAAGRDRSDVEVTIPVMAAVVDDGPDREKRLQAARMQIAFYGSTPAYRGVLEYHGWGALGEELTRLSKAGEWQAMGDLIEDDVVDTFGVMGESPTKVAAEVRRRFGGIADRVQTGYDPAREDACAGLVAALRSD